MQVNIYMALQKGDLQFIPPDKINELMKQQRGEKKSLSNGDAVTDVASS